MAVAGSKAIKGKVHETRITEKSTRSCQGTISNEKEIPKMDTERHWKEGLFRYPFRPKGGQTESLSGAC